MNFGGQIATGSDLWRWLSRISRRLDALEFRPPTNRTWYIDAVNGRDRNRGDAPGSALQTHAEFQRRIGIGSRIDDYVTVFVLSDLAEAIAPRVHIGPSGSLNYIAAVTETLKTGVITRTGTTIEMAGVADWSTAGPQGQSLVGEMIRDVSNGSRTWIASRLDNPAQALISTAMVFDEIAMSSTQAVDLGSGNQCVVERRASIPIFDFSRLTQEPTRTAGKTIFPVHLTGFRITEISHASFPGYLVNLVRCSLPYVNVLGGFPWFEQCRFAGSPVSMLASSGAYWKAGRACVHNEVRVEHGGVLWFSNAGTLQGARVRVDAGGVLALSSVMFYDCGPDYGIRLRPGSKCFAYYSTPGGAVASGVPLWVEGGALFAYPAGSPPSFVGPTAGSDFRLGRASAAAQAWAELGANGIVEPTTGAAILPYDP